MKINLLFLIGVLAVAGIVAPGCASKLESGGAYAPVDPVTGVATVAPDKAFYVVDASFDLAYSTIDAVFKFERDNRALLWKASPEIKHTLDKIRPEAVKVRDEYSAARRLYLENPVPANLNVLQSVLAKLQQITIAASAVLPAGAN